jgi:hypothetical protein
MANEHPVDPRRSDLRGALLYSLVGQAGLQAIWQRWPSMNTVPATMRSTERTRTPMTRSGPVRLCAGTIASRPNASGVAHDHFR